MMPRMDGPTLVKHLREERKTRFLPVIFVTASDDESLFGGKEEGAVDCVGKPFRVRDILARVHLQLQLGKRRLKLEDEFEARSYELQVLGELSPVSFSENSSVVIIDLGTSVERSEYLGQMRKEGGCYVFLFGSIFIEALHRLTYLNPAWYQITGYPAGRERDEWLDHIAPESKDAALRVWKGCFENRESAATRLLWKNDVWTHAVIAPLINADGSFAGSFGAVMDINEQYRLEEARIALAEEREHIAASRAEDAETQRQLEVKRRTAQGMLFSWAEITL
ncbi:response regulator receiver domain-containing protein [Rhizoctonia solani AG-1 IA]|uniref:Response regulator receiver domain-containing protein n=1 Tax=Thanatephorus cucumeris (strain AG1-IA) TaxID=983506 RepID=L8WKA5_THACA|nr:response regulator receiver domain-containing protein [Rhizoctonia solani AG-1 IA]